MRRRERPSGAGRSRLARSGATLWDRLAVASGGRLAAVDPGLNRLRSATSSALGIALTLGAEWVFVGRTHALEEPRPARATAAQLAALGAQHHDVLVIAMLLGGLVAMLAGMNANEPTARGLAATLAFIPATVAAMLTVGLAVGHARVGALVLMVAVLTVGAYGRRFGQRGGAAGVVIFIGYFYGFFLSGGLTVSAAGWLAAEVALAGLAVGAVRAIAFRPAPALDLRLSLASYRAQVGRILGLVLALGASPTDRRRRRLQSWLVRLDETALIVEGQLARAGASGSPDPSLLHLALFDAEVALTNIARYVDLMGAMEPAPDRERAVRTALSAAAAGRWDQARAAAADLRSASGPGVPDAGEGRTRWVVEHRFAGSVDALASALARLPDDPSAPSGPHASGATATTGTFQPAVALRGGWLPGSADVSSEAASLPGTAVRLAPYLRTSAQMGVAVAVAIAAGDALDAQRFYWAVVAALLALVGTNTVAEQLRKAAMRVVGTLAGVVAGTGLVELVGHHSVWSLVVVVGVMWAGMYWFRVNYAVMALAVTASLSQAYVSLGEFSDGLLWERLAETAVGAGAAMLTVLVVLPLHTRRVLDVALANAVDALDDLAGRAVSVLHDPGAVSDPAAHAELSSAGRRLDVAFQALMATAEPLRMVAWADNSDRLSVRLQAVTAARNYARNLVADAWAGAGTVPARLVEPGLAVFHGSAASLAGFLRGGDATPPEYVRAGAMFADAEHAAAAALPAPHAGPGDAASTGGRPPASMLALRDLLLLDGSLATLAAASGVRTRRPQAGDVPGHPATATGGGR